MQATKFLFDAQRAGADKTVRKLRQTCVHSLVCIVGGKVPMNFAPTCSEVSFALAKFDLWHRSRAATPSFLLHSALHDSDKAVRNPRQSDVPFHAIFRAGMMSPRAERFPRKIADARDSIARVRRRHITKYFRNRNASTTLRRCRALDRSAHPVDALVASMASMIQTRASHQPAFVTRKGARR